MRGEREGWGERERFKLKMKEYGVIVVIGRIKVILFIVMNIYLLIN